MHSAGTADLTGVDLSDVEGFWTRPLAERARAFAAMRGADRLPFFPEPQTPLVEPGPGFYAVTRHRDVLTASRNPEVFTSGAGATNIPDMPVEFLEFFGSMINMDNPRHARLRRVVSRGFTPARIARLSERVGEVATRIVDDVIDAGECDMVTDVAARLPLQIICDLMGIPASQHRFVFDRSNVVLGFQDPEYVAPDADVATALLTAANELAQLVKDLAAVRADHPTDDLTSALVSAEIDGERLTPDELASFFILLVVAGNETTRNAISWGAHLLSEHPGQRDAWAGDIDGLGPAAVEEIVRWACPVIFMRRTVAAPVELGGTRLRAGDKVALFYWSANRDEALCGDPNFGDPNFGDPNFGDPETFDIRRSPNPHVGFGGPGPHFCLGAHLARQEIAAMFGELLRRIPDLHATGPPRRLKSMFINGVKHLPVAFTAGGSR